MKTVVVYPVPMETPEVWELFKPFVERFCRTYQEFNPGAEHELYFVANVGEGDGATPANDALARLDAIMPHQRILIYRGGGADIGSFQFFAKQAYPCFMVCCVSRVYFHRAHWLKKLVRSRLTFGPGLYGTSASWEGGTFHVCTRCYAMDSDIFAGYPTMITSRDQGTYFEVGRGNVYGTLGDWFRHALHLPVYLEFFHDGITWASDTFSQEFSDPVCGTLADAFRHGDQSNLLVWDKHSDAYARASDEGKEYLRDLMLGVSHPPENVGHFA